MNNHKQTPRKMDETDLLPVPKEEMTRRLKLIELLTDTERDMLGERHLWEPGSLGLVDRGPRSEERGN